MTANLGNFDRVVRAMLGLILLVAPLLNKPAIWSNGTFAFASMAIGIILLGTSLFRFCPLYRLIGISTCRF
ncbi:YgaP family membrane protein [Sulfitobacter sp. JB4-11]|uniref:YgaP family membrane protein n=1 Tax=Sulfitobacter rhodophyticola TaxID=3238304 RepID=UPI003517981E